ncbi:hypothetical protein [Desulfotomaculum nigrificans]|uniref:hypothetical protein n=1 Tax=Desulfotomaculum nigrificans TaxID=1565 RepID=UPI0001FAE378|nr:hypothetical protein [Desulfotomaculum nigrificans]
MENNKHEESVTSTNTATFSPNQARAAETGGLDEALFKLLNFQAQHGADQNYTMIMLALMNLLGIVNCMERLLPEGARTGGAADLASRIAGMLGVPNMPPPAPPNNQGAPKGGIDPAMLAALAGMFGGPRGPAGPGEAAGKGGIEPALLAALASMMGGPGGGPNPAALMGMLANMMGLGSMRPAEPHRKEAPSREEKPSPPEEKPGQAKEPPNRESGPMPLPRGVLRWDPRLGSPTSSN